MVAKKPPTSHGLPASILASKAVVRREQYSGTVQLAQLERLGVLLAETQGELQVEIEASKDGSGAGRLGGQVTGNLVLLCQRGLHPFSWPCSVDFSLVLVDSDDDEGRVLQEQDPYLVQDDRLPLRDIVEDEILLALPMMPKCDDLGCMERLK